MPASLPGKIGDYQVLGELGRGGMGIVYKVKDARNGQLCALKIIPPESLARPDSALRFKREFRAMQRVEHPNVIRVFESGTHDSCPYFTMELIEGKDIRRWLDGDELIVPQGKDPPPAGVLSPQQRARLNDPMRVKKLADAIIQVSFALTAIHSHRIVHRDLKPDNIMVSRAGLAKLMDFGIAKQLTGHSEHSSGGMVVGTFKYLSPEQALGADIDGRADLYCLGIILYELLAGRHPFYSENSVGYAYHHARKPPPPIDRFNPEVHTGLKQICERLIKKDPRERYPTAEDVIVAVREKMEGYEEQSSRLRAAAGPVGKLPFELARDQLFQPALVGREKEKQKLLQSCEHLLAGRGHIVAVTGQKGIGKTRLVREVAGLAKAKSVELLWGKCSRDGGLPYQPFIDVLDQIIDQAAKSRGDEVQRLLGAEGPILARYLSSIERLDPRARPRPAAPLEPQGERVRFVSAVSTFLGRASAAQARVLVLDDVHHADEASLGLARHLADTVARGDVAGDPSRVAPLTLILTLDPADQSAPEARALLSRLSQEKAFVSLSLPHLGAVEVREMLQSMIGGGEVAQALADFLHHETDGVPGLVEERVRAWAEAGELRRKGRQWVLMKKVSSESQQRTATALKRPPAEQATASLVPSRNVLADASDLPGSLPDPLRDPAEGGGEVVELRAATRADIPVVVADEKLGEKRVARLGALARDVAERMAVAGERVHATLVERIALRREEELLDALDELLKRGIVAEDKGEAWYRFAGADDRQALLDLLPKHRRQHLHQLVARAIEEDARKYKRATNPEDLARHYLEGGEPLKAFEHLLAAARIALAASATQTAADRVREAQELFTDELRGDSGGQSSDGRARDAQLAKCDAELVLLRLDVLAAVGEHKECAALAKRRLAKMRGHVDPRTIGEILLRLAGSERSLGELDAAVEHVGEVLGITERGGAHALRCRAKSLCGQIYEQRGQFERSERYYNDALELARAIGDELEEERARSAIAGRRLLAGDLQAARRDFESLLASAQARGEKLRITGYVNSLGIIAHEAGQYDEAEVAYRRMIELAKPAGDRRSVATGLGNIGVVRRDQERYDDALSLCAKAARVLSEIEAVEQLGYVRIVEAQILLEKGDDAGAAKKAQEAVDLAEKSGASLRVAEARICRGLAVARRGDARRGLDDVHAGLEAARAVGANRVVLYGILAESEAKMIDGAAGEAAALLREGLQRARATGFQRFVFKYEAAQRRLKIPA